jgi:type I restriction enzyme, S subunit
MSEWAIFKLGALCPKITDGSHRSPADFVGGLPMFSVKDMEIQGFNYSRVKTICEEEFNLLVKSGCQPEVDDILIAKDGSVMKHIFRVKTNPDYVLLSSIAILKPNKSYIFPQFLVYAIKSPETIDTILTNYVSGSGVPRIVLKDFKNVEINIPPLPEQKAIAAVLSSLDDKIDLLHRQNKTLEAMAETLFRQWFIEEAKEDWEECSITDLFEVRDGTHDSPKQSLIGRPLITSKHILDGRIDIDNAYLISQNDYEKINQRSKVDSDDILFSMIGTIGLLYLEQSLSVDYAIKNIGLFKTSQNPEWKTFTYLWLKSDIGRQFIDEHISGSTQEYVSLGSLRSIKFQKPPSEKLVEFNDLISGFFSKLYLNRTQIQTLEKLRDNLLPKLMSGEVRVQYG